jgi:hypothetical protein
MYSVIHFILTFENVPFEFLRRDGAEVVRL